MVESDQWYQNQSRLHILDQPLVVDSQPIPEVARHFLGCRGDLGDHRIEATLIHHSTPNKNLVQENTGLDQAGVKVAVGDEDNASCPKLQFGAQEAAQQICANSTSPQAAGSCWNTSLDCTNSLPLWAATEHRCYCTQNLEADPRELGPLGKASWARSRLQSRR